MAEDIARDKYYIISYYCAELSDPKNIKNRPLFV
jgi:hypothetical protein